jgi:hypothetical protein
LSLPWTSWEPLTLSSLVAVLGSSVRTWTTCIPVAFYDLLGLTNDFDTSELKVDEIKNGRLALISKHGYYVRKLETKAGPLENQTSHVADSSNPKIFRVCHVRRL